MILIRHGQSEFNVHFNRTGIDPGITDPHLVYGEYHRHYEVLEDIDGTVELGESPLDPVAESAQSWQQLPAESGEEGVAEVRSGAAGTGSDGQPYASY